MFGRFTWLGGKPDPKQDAASVRRARAHRRSIPKAARDSERWEARDRQRFSR